MENIFYSTTDEVKIFFSPNKSKYDWKKKGILMWEKEWREFS